jgi:hypothetical protein
VATWRADYTKYFFSSKTIHKEQIELTILNSFTLQTMDEFLCGRFGCGNIGESGAGGGDTGCIQT